MHAGEHVIAALGLGDFERLHHLHARGVARKIIVEGALVDGHRACARKNRTRATAVLRRPVAQMIFFFSAIIVDSMLHRMRLLRRMGMLRARVYLQLGE